MSFDLGNPKDYFQIPGRMIEFRPLKIGHIHDTWISWWKDSGVEQAYIHQRINEHVFRNIPGLMNNINLVLTHVGNELKKEVTEDRSFNLVPACDGQLFCKLDEDSIWRTFEYVKGTESYFVCDSEEKAYAAAKCCGRFLQRVSSLDSGKLVETIPNFTNSRLRFQALREILETGSVQRAKMSSNEIEFAFANEKYSEIIMAAVESKKLPLRVAHNDLKFNNVLFNKGTANAVAVVDLDTCMPGTWAYDFGDFLRNTCVSSSEDETDLDKVGIDLNYFEASARGFFEVLGNTISESERELFPLAPAVLALTLGVRFLTDFIGGDKYFKTHRPQHNLDRARTQFQVFRDIIDKQAKLESICRS